MIVSGEPLSWPTLFRLKPGVTRAEFLKIAHRTDLLRIGLYGSIVFDANAPAGTSSAQTILQPGNYFADDLYGNVGPSPEFTIRQAANPATLPKPEATISAIAFAFGGPTTLHDGELVRFQNTGHIIHMIAWASTKDTATATKIESLLRAGQGMQAKKYATGKGTFAGPLSAGAVQQLTIDEKPGVYVLYSPWITKDGRKQYQLGIRTIRILLKWQAGARAITRSPGGLLAHPTRRAPSPSDRSPEAGSPGRRG
ncbi:MAG: hypothetical protein ACLP8S_06070 [Solirubrobacteraceae bacterium]